MILHHYTCLKHLKEGILPDRQLRLTDSNLSETVADPGVVWFMDSADPSLVRGNPMLQSSVDKTQIRITCELTSDAYCWDKWAPRQKGFNSAWAGILDQVSMGTRSRWWICTRPVPEAEWVTIEAWDSDAGGYKVIS